MVDNTEEPHNGFEGYPSGNLEGVNDVWRMTTNLGCPCHFYPAIALFEYEYVMFADDDFLPEPRALETLLGWALTLQGNFATIGATGRIFTLKNPSGRKYSGHSYPRPKPKEAVPCDLTCRASLVRQDFIHHFITFRQNLLMRFGNEAIPLVKIHDDFLMCLGIQWATGLRSYCIGKSVEGGDWLFGKEMDTEGGLWRRPSHFTERNKMVDMCLGIGWRTLV